MKTRTLVSILILTSALFFIIGNCATASKTQEAKEVVNLGVFFQSVRNCDIAEVKRLIKAGADAR